MAKKTAKSADALVEEIKAKVDELAALAGASSEGGEESSEETVSLPSPKEIAKLKGDKVTELAEALSIDTEGKNEKQLKEILTLASRFASEEELDKAEKKKLAAGLGVTVDKIGEYLTSGAADEEESEDEESDDESEEEDSEEESEEAEEEESDEADEEEEDDADDEDSEEESEDEEDSDEDEESEEEEESEDEESDDDDDADEESEEESEDEDEGEGDYTPTKKDLEAYNKIAKKKLKKPEELVALLTGDDEVVHEFGTAYIKDEAAWGSGFPLKDVDDDNAKDIVTGKLYTFNDDDELVEVKAKKAKK